MSDNFGTNTDASGSDWLSVISAVMVLFGFILPWFSCKLSSLISGTVSGLSILAQLTIGICLGLTGVASEIGNASDDSLAGVGILLMLVLLIPTIILASIPFSALRIGRAGHELTQSLDPSPQESHEIARRIRRAAITGLLILFVIQGTVTISIDFSGLGIPLALGTAELGIWITWAGFGIAFFAAMVIESAATRKQQRIDSQPDPSQPPPKYDQSSSGFNQTDYPPEE